MKEVLQTFEREVDVLVHLWIGGEEIVTTQTHPARGCRVCGGRDSGCKAGEAVCGY